jgi:predicted dienelactone hydrolase
MRRLALTALAALFPLQAALADTLPGYDRLDIAAEHRARPIAGTIWYPAASPTYRVPVGAGPIFQPVPAFMGPQLAAGRHRLVLLSHGSGGNADALGWLSSGLVARGAIVLAVNHPGSTSGDSSPRRAVDLAARAADLSAALDHVLADPAFAPHVAAEDVAVVGFSLGGTTALTLAGLRFDGVAQDRRCATAPDAADCGFFQRGGVVFAQAPGFSADGRDRRIARSVAIDPGFTWAVTPESLDTALPGITLINLGEADRLPAVDVGPGGSDLARRLPGATHGVVAPANHFTFLGVCQPGAPEILAAEGDDPICTDPEGVDRAATHARLIADIARALGLD